MTHRYTAASDGWLAFITPARQLFVGAALEPADVDRLWTRIRDERGPAGVLEALTSRGLFATPPFAFVESGDGGVDVIVRGDAVVRSGAEQVSGSGATTWIERRLPGGSVGVALGGSGSLELPLEAGVVRASAFATGGAAPGSVAPAPTAVAAPVAAAAPAPASPPAAAAEPSSPLQPSSPPESPAPPVPAASDPVEVTLPPELALAPVSEETVAAVADEFVASAPPPAAPAAEPADGYDYLFGETMYRSVADAAVRTEEPAEDDAAVAGAAPAAVEGDHDGSTVLASSITRSGRVRRPRGKGEAPAPAPTIVLVLPSGTREVIDPAIVLGRSPSVSGVPAGQLPRLVTLSGGDQDISRSHLRVALEGGTVVVTDLHSRNGTTIVSPSGESQKLRGGEPTPVIVGTLIDLGGGVELKVEEL